jgi:hypothetical protein
MYEPVQYLLARTYKGRGTSRQILQVNGTSCISPLLARPTGLQLARLAATGPTSTGLVAFALPAQGPLNFAAAHEPCQSCQARGCANGKGSAAVPTTEPGVPVRDAVLSSTSWGLSRLGAGTSRSPTYR